MAVTAKMVKELREMTGAGMMDCKKGERPGKGCKESGQDRGYGSGKDRIRS